MDTIRQPEHAPAALKLAASHPLRVLVAEDNIVNQKVVQLILAQFGYSADFAADGVETVAAIERHTYDLVLMDVQMPKMDGLEATRVIVSRWSGDSRPRIVGLTANVSDDDRRACFNAGMSDYLTKPVAATLLMDVLRRVRRRAD